MSLKVIICYNEFMKKRENVRIILRKVNIHENKFIFLITLVLIFLLISSISTSVDGFGRHAENSKAILSPSNIDNNIIIQNRDYRKVILKSSSSKIPYLLENQYVVAAVTTQSIKYFGTLIDSRQKIGRVISHYFHSSKYKGRCLFIHD